MPKPFEVVAAPFTVYWAVTGTAFPAIDAAPAAAWNKIGTSGPRNYSNDGVTVVHEQTIEQIRSLGGTGPIKALRTEEGLVVRFTLWDLTLEQYRLALDSNAVSTTAAGTGSAGFKKVDLYRGGPTVETMALLVRGDVSPYGDAWKSQYEIPVCFQMGSAEPVFVKNGPAGLALEFAALEDPDAAAEADRFGRLKIQHQTAI